MKQTVETLTGVITRVDDHITSEDKVFRAMEGRLDKIESDIRTLIIERGTKLGRILEFIIPILLSVFILGGGWIWGLSKQEEKIAELENGRYENKGRIEVLTQQLQKEITDNAVRDARFTIIMEQLKEIQKKVDQIHRSQ